MTARLKHVAIPSNNYPLLGKFYEALFGIKPARTPRPEAACVLSDGYVGLNLNPRKVGVRAGLDHFGFEVDDVETVFARVREAYPTVRYVQRPAIRPFAGITMHDPEGNTFDLSAAQMANRTDAYTDQSLAQMEFARRVHHLVLRALDPALLTRFYTDIFELCEQEKAPDDPNTYLSDGRVLLVIAPWQINDYLGMDIERPGLDHLGFVVESLEQFDADQRRLAGRNPYLRPTPLGVGDESEARLQLLRRCRFGQRQVADPDGVLLDVCVA